MKVYLVWDNDRHEYIQRSGGTSPRVYGTRAIASSVADYFTSMSSRTPSERLAEKQRRFRIHEFVLDEYRALAWDKP